MIDVIICNGFSGYTTYEDTYAIESPFLLYKNGKFGDITNLYKIFVDPNLPDVVTDIDAPPYVCYVLKQFLHNKGFSSEMVFYLDYERERMLKILSEPHHVVFLSTTLIPLKSDVLRAAREIRKISPESVIICGGRFIDSSYKILQEISRGNEVYNSCADDYFFCKDSLEESCIDLFIVNDPDLSVSEQVINGIKKGKKVGDIISSIPNCSLFNGKKWIFSNEFIEKRHILPEIDWSIFRDDEVRFSIPITFSVGCHNRCRFCNFQSISKRIEKDKNILAKELLSISEHHNRVKFLSFCDDDLCGTKQSVQSLIELLSDEKYSFYWSSLIDARFIDDAFAEKLKASGCRDVKIGMESADDRILTNMAKPCRVKHYAQAVDSLAKAGISIDAYFLVGFPGETRQTIQNTVDTINSFATPQYSANQFIFFPFILGPLSPIFEAKMRQQFNLSGHMFDWKHSTMDREQAASSIPEIVKQITTMQPFHGNAEKIVMANNARFANIDKLRGSIIRSKLHDGKENGPLWNQLEAAIKSLNAIPPVKNNPVTFE